MMKGRETKETILNAALGFARLHGLEGLSIGRLAKGVGLSKSGLFAHFNSKETLQLNVLQRGVEEFLEAVVRPAIKEPRGEPRLRALLDRWLRWAAGDSSRGKGGCLFLGAAVELDDQPGALRDYLVNSQRQWISTLARAVTIAQTAGDISPDVDTEQMAFEIYSIMMAFHLYHRLLRDPDASMRARKAFDKLLAASR